MKQESTIDKIEAGIDEAGRGPLFGRVYSAAVMIDNSFDNTRVKIQEVNEENVENWPSVKSNYLNKNDAIQVFNYYFN